MIPNKSNTTNGCNNTSSNCVIWQGPDLTCVNICNGDTISDVVAKLAEQLCECCGLTANGNAGARSGVNVDIRTVNQLCLETDYGKANNIQTLLNNIITKVCAASGQSEVDVCSCVINLPQSLRESAKKYLNTTDNVETMVLYDSTINKGYAHFLAEQIVSQGIAINDVNRLYKSINGRIVSLEAASKRNSTVTLPKVTLSIGGTGRQQSIETAIVATNVVLSEYASVFGSTGNVNSAIAAAPNLASRDRLSGNGTMSAIKSWISLPRNLAQSFQNLWLTTNDIRNAVESMKETVANPLCSDLTFDVKGTVEKANGNTAAISLDFSDSIIPKTYNDCNSRGTKITISDSSLNSKVYYVNVAGHYQNSNTPYRIAVDSMGNLDISSNYSVKVEFCFSNGDNQCSEIQNFTIHNETACPTLSIGTITADTIPFTVSDLKYAENNGYVVTVELKTNSGSLLDSRSFTTFRANLVGTFSNLKSSTQYKVNTKVTKSGITEKADCPVQLVSTTAPSCVSTVYTPTSTEWKTDESLLQTGANTLEIATYNDGVSQTKWQVGFATTNTPIIVQATTTGVTGWNHQGSFINNELPTESLHIDGLVGSPVGPSGIGRTDLESGWKYIGTIKSPTNQLYYIYASVNTTTHTVPQVIFSCNCSGLYLKTDQPAFYCGINEAKKIKVSVCGYTAGAGNYTWNISTQPTHGSLTFAAGSPTASFVEYTYRQDGTTMVADSFVVTLTNDCGVSVGTKFISILPAKRIPYTNTEVIVFFDSLSMTPAQALDIKSSFNSIRNNLVGTKPNFSYIAVNGAQSSDYLKHIKACVENVGSFNSAGASGAAISIPGAGTWWDDVMQAGSTRPSYWTTANAELPTSVHVISFVGKSSTYGALTVPTPASWGGQPTASGGGLPYQYKEDYDAIIDITSDVAPTSAWGTHCQAQANFPWLSGSIPFTMSQVVVTVLNDTAGQSAAAALQTSAALQGETLLTVQETQGLKLGLDRLRWDGLTGINLNSYLLSGVAPVNTPYSGLTTASNTMKGLKDVSGYFGALHAYIENGIDFDLSTNSDILTYFRGMFNLDPTGSAGEPTSPGAYLMQGTGSVSYAESTTSAADACAKSAVAGNLINIYNADGSATNQFNVDHKAYKSLSGAVNAQSEYELTNGYWYAGGGGGAKRRAQYSTSYPHWTNDTAC